MKWKDYKKKIEDEGITDESEIWFIDIELDTPENLIMATIDEDHPEWGFKIVDAVLIEAGEKPK